MRHGGATSKSWFWRPEDLEPAFRSFWSVGKIPDEKCFKLSLGKSRPILRVHVTSFFSLTLSGLLRYPFAGLQEYWRTLRKPTARATCVSWSHIPCQSHLPFLCK